MVHEREGYREQGDSCLYFSHLVAEQVIFPHEVTGWPVREQDSHTEGSFLSAKFVPELFLPCKFLRKDTFLNILRCHNEVPKVIFTSVFMEKSMIRYLTKWEHGSRSEYCSSLFH